MRTTTRSAGYGRVNVFVDGTLKGYVVGRLGAFRAFDTDGRLIEDRARGFQGYGYGLRREAVDATARA